MLTKYKMLSVTSIIEQLGWRTLEQRRSDARLSLMYNIVHQLVAIPTDQLIPPSRPTRHSHSSSFRQLQATKNVYKYSFFPLTNIYNGIIFPSLNPAKTRGGSRTSTAGGAQVTNEAEGFTEARSAPKGGGWGRGSPPPAGGGRSGGLPRKFFEKLHQNGAF